MEILGRLTVVLCFSLHMYGICISEKGDHFSAKIKSGEIYRCANVCSWRKDVRCSFRGDFGPLQRMHSLNTLLRLPNDSWTSHGGKKLAFLKGGSAQQRSGSYLGHSNWVPTFLHGSFLPLSYSTALTGYAHHYQKPRSFHLGQVVPKQVFWCTHSCSNNEQIM